MRIANSPKANVLLLIAMTFVVPKVVADQEMLQVLLQRPLSFPKIRINEASQNGSICVANSMKNSANSLCPNKHGNTAQIKITGSPNSMVMVNLDSPPGEQHGLRFNATGTPISLTLNNNGKKEVELGGQLTLINRNQTKDGKHLFSYDITVAYQ